MATDHYSQSPFDLSHAERGVSGLDYPNVASIYMLFEVPALSKQNGLTRTLLGGWQINPVWRYVSGQPYTVIENATPAFNFTNEASPNRLLCDPTQTSGSTTCRPIIASRHAPIDSVGQCTDPSASGCGLVNYYTGAPVSQQDVHWIVNDDLSAAYYGTPFAGGGRNQQRGQTINNANLAILKDFKFHDRFTIETRGTAYTFSTASIVECPSRTWTTATLSMWAAHSEILCTTPTAAGRLIRFSRASTAAALSWARRSGFERRPKQIFGARSERVAPDYFCEQAIIQMPVPGD